MANRRFKPPLRVSFVTSEVQPFSKTGGLGDVSRALPAALAALGAEVTVFSPLYPSVRERLRLDGDEPEPSTLPGVLWIGNERHPATFRELRREGVRFVFVENDAFFARPHPYTDEHGADYEDSVARFAYFCRAVLEHHLAREPIPDVVHVHDWQASLVAVYLKTLYRQPQLAGVSSVLTIHNLGYQGNFPAEHIYATGLNWDVFHMEGLEYYGRLNLLKGGIVFADAVTTVSPTYAREIQTAEGGCGLDGLLRKHAGKVTGILNGIDVSTWDPASDPNLARRYAPDDLAGKSECKRALQQRLGLPGRKDAFLLGVITRLAEQKGTPLLLEAFPQLADLDVQLVLLGSGAADLERAARALMEALPRRVACVIGFDDVLAHQIEAGADAFVMPSKYEPCGLNQMYSQRYGTVPIVRETGGLADTVVDATARALASGKASGFVFRDFTSTALEQAVRRAESLYRNSDKWYALVRSIMKLDRSWEKSAREYVKLYRSLVRRTKEAGRDG